MFKCEKCKTQSKEGDTQFRYSIKKPLEKGSQITGEKKLCKKCYNKIKGVGSK